VAKPPSQVGCYFFFTTVNIFKAADSLYKRKSKHGSKITLKVQFSHGKAGRYRLIVFQ